MALCGSGDWDDGGQKTAIVLVVLPSAPEKNDQTASFAVLHGTMDERKFSHLDRLDGLIRRFLVQMATFPVFLLWWKFNRIFGVSLGVA